MYFVSPAIKKWKCYGVSLAFSGEFESLYEFVVNR